MQYIFDGKCVCVCVCGGVSKLLFFKGGGGDVSPRKYIVATPMIVLVLCYLWT